MNKNNFFKKITLILALFILISGVLAPTANAQEKAKIAQEAQATESGSFDNIKQIIKENIENSKVKGAIDNLLNRKIAIIGEITRVTDETITISNRLGNRIIPIPKDVFITKAAKEIAVSDIAVENWIVILGKIKDDDFTPVFMDISTETLQPKTQFVEIGTITTFGKNSLTIIPRSSTEEKQIDLVKNTTYEDLDGEPISLNNLTEDITVLVSGYESDSGIEASTIRSIVEVF